MALTASPVEPLLSVRQVAELLNVTEDAVRVWARSGSLPGIKLGVNTWRFDPTALRAWVAEHSEP